MDKGRAELRLGEVQDRLHIVPLIFNNIGNTALLTPGWQMTRSVVTKEWMKEEREE